MKIIIIILGMFVSTQAFSWFFIIDGECQYEATASPTAMLAAATNKNLGGFSDCKIITVEKDAQIVGCLNPEPITWFILRNVALCNKYKDIHHYTVLKYVDYNNKKFK